MQLLLERNRKQLCIVSNPIHTYHNIARYQIAAHIIESDNIGVRIVIQIFSINFQQILVITKKIANLPYPAIIIFDNELYPVGNFFLLVQKNELTLL